MQHIKFVKPAGPYSAGDIAGFVPEVAETYIKRGVAEVAWPVKAVAEVEADDKTNRRKK